MDQPLPSQPMQPSTSRREIEPSLGIQSVSPEAQANVQQVRQTFEKPHAQNSTEQELLKLEREIHPGVTEQHDPEQDAVPLPSLIADANIATATLPPGALLTVDSHLVMPPQTEIKEGLSESVDKSGRWWAEEWVRLLKEAYRVAKMKLQGKSA